MSRLVIDRAHTNIKITNNIKINRIMVSISDHYNSIFIDRVPYKYKNWQFYCILIIAFQISLFSLHVPKVTFSA